MSEPTARLPLSWARVRQIARPLGLPSLPGWLLVAFEVAEKAHLVTSIAEHTWLAGFLREWGWLIGISWLLVVVLWEARKPRDAELRRARAMMQLQAATVDVLRRFEALCVSYEQTPAFRRELAGEGTNSCCPSQRAWKPPSRQCRRGSKVTSRSCYLVCGSTSRNTTIGTRAPKTQPNCRQPWQYSAPWSNCGSLGCCRPHESVGIRSPDRG
jgi:hypothetical protein